MLHVLEDIPAGLLESDARTLYRVLPGPTLMHLAGRREPPLFVSVLLHGNEDTGLRAVQRLLARYRGRTLPRALSVFFGNVAAARYGVRRLPEQPDFNRIWPGGEPGDTPEHRMLRRVVEVMGERGVFASVDVHNNTGRNPHYGCVNRLDHRFLHLAVLFSRTVVYFMRPKGVQSEAFTRLCPAVTVECGKVGDEHGVTHTLEYLDACLHLSEIPHHPVAEGDLDLFHTVAVVKVPEAVSFDFGGGDADLCLAEDLDHLNFRELPPGSVIGRVRGSGIPLDVHDEEGRDVRDHYFRVEDGELRTVRAVVPSMFTTEVQAIRQDCLGYLMEGFNPGT